MKSSRNLLRKKKDFIVDINSKCDVNLVGRKAFNLSRMAKKGFCVPEGFCITTKAYDWFIDFNTITDVTSDALIKGEMPPQLAELITDACTSLNSTCAVRSSSPVEDLERASSAGQYTSVLNVPKESVVDAVKECWASLWSEKAVTYRERAGITKNVKMAVLVQEMVPVTASGVMVTGDTTVVEAVWGLGDLLVGGKIIPDRFCVRGSMIKERTIAHKPIMSHRTATGVKVIPVPDHLQDQPVLDDDHLLKLCTLSKKVEAFFGCPQDIEWGFLTDFVILQARPITVKEPIVWSRANAAETIPGYVTYLSRVPEDRPDYIVLGLTPLLACFGIKDVEHLKVTEYLYGHVYLNMSVARSVVGQIPGLSPDVLYQSLGHTSDEEVRPALTVSDMIKLAPGTVRVIQFFLQLPKRARKVIPHSLTLLEDIRHKKKELQTLTLEELDTLIWDVYERNSQVFQVHTVTALAVFGLFGIVQKIVDRVGEPGMETMLTMGLTGMSSSQLGVKMWKLAQSASQLSAVSDVILGGNNVLEELTKVEEGITFLERLDTFIQECGDRCSEEMELSTPRWEEDPAFVLSMVAHYLQSDADPVKTIKKQKKKRLKARDIILKKMNVVEKVLFTKILEKTEQYIVMRENLKTTWAKGLSVLRVLYLAIAEKLVEKKMLEEKDDIFYLKRTEVTDIIKGKLEKKECENRIKERKEEKRLCQHIDVPEVVVGKPPPLEELQCTVERKDVLQGAGCSPGVVTGKARVVTNPRECSFGEGDILVAPITDPGWSPFFVTAGGLVMELGGTLSHGIIIAREYGIPAVVGAKNATRLIKTGQIITVDGNTGVVSINRK